MMPVLSVYLNTQPDQHGRDNFSPFLRKELKARASTYPTESSERLSFEQDANRIRLWLGDRISAIFERSRNLRLLGSRRLL
jgi:hypothetical protein